MMDKGKNKVLIVLACLIIAGVFVVNIASYGFSGGIANITNNISSYLFYIGVIAVIVAGLYFWFIYEKKVNVTEENLKNLISECKINLPSRKHFGNLWLKGDKNHKEVKIGRIIGYSRRQNFKLIPIESSLQVMSEEEFKKEVKEMKVKSKYDYIIKRRKERKGSIDKYYNELYFVQEEDIFLVRRYGKKIVVRATPNLHTDLFGDVKLLAISLVKHSVYYYPNSMHLDFDSIDTTIYNEALRYTQLHFTDNMINILRRATGLTKEEQMEVTQGKTGAELINERRGK